MSIYRSCLKNGQIRKIKVLVKFRISPLFIRLSRPITPFLLKIATQDLYPKCWKLNSSAFYAVKLVVEILFDQAVAKTVNQHYVRPFLPLQRRCGQPKWWIFLIKSTLRQGDGANATLCCYSIISESLEKFPFVDPKFTQDIRNFAVQRAPNGFYLL